MLKDLLETKKCFKLICGAGKEDCEEVKRLVYLYAIAGCRFFDLSASIEVINSAKEALSTACVSDAFLCVSFGIKNDPHTNKACIDYNKCINCGSCEGVCSEGAIHYAKIKKDKCIGCGKCWKVCPKSAISYISEEKNIKEILPVIKSMGVDCLEFHIIGQDRKGILSKWKYLCENFDGYLSVCVSRGKFGDDDLIECLNEMKKYCSEEKFIIQADGYPMSGGNDDYKTTLQAVATAEVIQNYKIPAYILLSGGTNSKTAELARLCGVNYNGIAVGSYARKIVREYINSPNFWDSENIRQKALEKIRPLINSVIL